MTRPSDPATMVATAHSLTRGRHAVLLVVVLALLVGGCGDVGRVLNGTPPAPGPDPVAVLPTDDARPPVTPDMTATPVTPAPTAAGTPAIGPDTEPPAGPQGCDGPACTDEAAIAAAVAAATAPVVIALDASVAMSDPLAGSGGGPSRLEAAQDAVQRLVVGTPGYADTGVVTFGAAGDGTEGGRTESCSTVTTLSFPGDATPDDADAAAAVGWRPIASMLDIVVPVLAQVGEGTGPLAAVTPGRVVLVTAGADTCGRDPISILEGLSDPPVVDVLALSPTPAEGEVLAGLAEATGGRYAVVMDAATAAAAADALAARAVDDLRPALVAPPSALVTVLTDLAAQAQTARQAVVDRYGTPPPGEDLPAAAGAGP